MAQFRPGSNPIQSLARALAADGVLYSGPKEDVPLDEIVETYLHQSAKGVVETFRKARLPEGTNLLVVADQFEELFRYWKVEGADGQDVGAANENAIAFVNLLLNAHVEPDCPIYVVITMRSDFLGDCSQFYGLPEAINQGQYLVPRMTRDERRASIAGPVSVGGAEISPVLLTRLVNDVGDNPDQLSILQHALNRTWACWESHGAQAELNLDHYTEIGTMSEALNQHANEAFELLETEQKKTICRKLFKALTDLGTDARGIRRPLKLATLTEIAATGSQEQDVKDVIEVFRDPSRAFLMPPAGEPLEPQKVIDISHESLMRVWKQLRNWAEEESDSARRYRRLAETAALEKSEKAGLWRDPDLQLTLDWKEEREPTQAWANLYSGDFESAIDFLQRSQSQRDHELAEVVFERRWKRIRWSPVLLIVGVFLWRFMAGDFTELSKRFEDEKANVKNDLSQLAKNSKQKDNASSDLSQPAKSPEQEANVSSDLSQLAQSPKKSPISMAAVAKYVIGLARLARFFGPYFLSYVVLAVGAKRLFRRLAFGEILQEVALSSRKAVREQKMAEQDLAEAVVRLQTTYASGWRRVGAYVLDLALFMCGVVGLFIGGISIASFLPPLLADYFFLGLLLSIIVAHWLYDALMLSSRRQATLGMLAFGIFATDEKGNRLHFSRATARHFAKFLCYMTLWIGFLIQPFRLKRQTLSDLISRSVVLVRTNRKKVPWWLILLCVVIGATEAVPMLYILMFMWGLVTYIFRQG
jgi:uncharacterized RDD family membrane protein YckC